MRDTARPSAGAESVVVVVPIYKPALTSTEEFAVNHSLNILRSQPCVFICPDSLDIGYYRERWPWVSFSVFEANHFESVASYSRLLLSPSYYERFISYEYMLILQTDAILFRDELNIWIKAGFDYVGAPWPEGIEITLWRDNFQGERRQRVRTHVGNGGLSLRNIGRCRELLAEFPETLAAFRQSGTNEDAYFSLLGPQSKGFRIPDEVTASRFSLELAAEPYLKRNGGEVPLGMHRWKWLMPPSWQAVLLGPDAANWVAKDMS